ncbi:MAG: DNA-directed RNA polymerase subunit K, partial [Candidatus Bathyarchaeia archaeon]
QKIGEKKGRRGEEGQKGEAEGEGMSKTSLQIIGPPRLTRFEKARIVGARALQLSMGARPLIDVPSESMSPRDIALLELEEGVLPISIRRVLPDGTSQNIPLKWLLKKRE